MSQLFEHGLARLLAAPEFTPGGQRVLVGTKLMGDSWVATIIRLDGCASHDEAAWIGARIQADLVDYIGVMNDEDGPPEAVAIVRVRPWCRGLECSGLRDAGRGAESRHHV